MFDTKSAVIWTRQRVYACEVTSAMMTLAIRRFRSGGNEASGDLLWKVSAGTAPRIRPAALIGEEKWNRGYNITTADGAFSHRAFSAVRGPRFQALFSPFHV